MQRNNGVPLLVCYLRFHSSQSPLLSYPPSGTDFMYDSIPSKAGIVDNDMDLPTTKLSGLLHELIDVLRV